MLDMLTYTSNPMLNNPQGVGVGGLTHVHMYISDLLPSPPFFILLLAESEMHTQVKQVPDVYCTYGSLRFVILFTCGPTSLLQTLPTLVH